MTYQEKIEQVIGIIQKYKKDMPEQEYKDILRTIIEDLQKNFKELGFNIFIEGRMLKNNLGIQSRVFAQKIVIQFEMKEDDLYATSEVLLNKGNIIVEHNSKGNDGYDWRALSLVGAALFEKAFVYFENNNPLEIESLEYVGQNRTIGTISPYNYLLRKYSILHIVYNDKILRNGLENTLFFANKSKAEQIAERLKIYEKILRFSENKSYLGDGILLETAGVLYEESIMDLNIILKTSKHNVKICLDIKGDMVEWIKDDNDFLVKGKFNLSEIKNPKKLLKKINNLYNS